MKISLNWLKDFVNLDGIDIKDLWYKFTMSTAEVDDVIVMGKEVSNVVVGRALKVEPHPSSKKLKIVQVDTGDGVVQCLCGAPNIAENLLVPFAKIGGSIKKVPEVKKVEIAGVESCGIICSAAELGISDDHSGVLVFTEDYKPGTDIKTIIDIDDILIEVDNKSLTNRPDLWGHYGIAREMAAIFKRQLKPLVVEEIRKEPGLPELNIAIEDTEKCFRYSGIVIENIKAKVTPLNMQVRLYYCGMRPISPIVDLTNYLLLEVGQPMHAFDRRFIEKVVVKSTKETTPFVTLDGSERKIPADVLMICNQEKPVALAGIMGGENSEVMDDTTAILLESANFEGSSIRKSSTKIGLRTEASARFEKKLDPEMTSVAIQRFVKLLRDMQGDIKLASNMTDVYPKKPAPITITIDKPYIDKYIGNIIDSGMVVDILKSLEFGVKQDGDRFTVDVPSFRATKDITMKVDIIEEITRIYGYDNIVSQTIDVALKPLEYNEEVIFTHRVKEILSESFAYSEVNSYIWYDTAENNALGITPKSNVKLLNPHAKDMDMLRDSLAPIMLGFAEKNIKAFDKVSLYEIGSVFKAENVKAPCEQHKNLCILRGDKTRDEDALFYELKGLVTYLLKLLKNMEPTFEKAQMDDPWVHPVKSVSVFCEGKPLGYISAVHPQIRQKIDKKASLAVLELNMPEVFALGQKQVKFAEPSKYPEVSLDFSFLVDNGITYEKVVADISGFKSELLMDSGFVGIYTGKGLPEGRKSMTFRFIIGSKERTLSSEDINQFSQGIIAYMEGCGYPLR